MKSRIAMLLVASPMLLAARGASFRPAERVVVSRHPNGAPAAERRYAGDREKGRHIGWWEDGSLRFVFTYHDGLMEGTARDWARGGRLYRETHYRHGQEEGLQRMWWPDGSLRASYVVRDGRRYGLLGAKGCVTPDSTEAK